MTTYHLRTLALSLCALGFASALQPAQAAGFDCKLAKTRIEKLICSDPGLSKLDEELKTAFEAAQSETAGVDGETGVRHDPVGDAQRKWIQGVRNPCRDTICLKRAYFDRLAALRGVVDDAPKPAAAAKAPATAAVPPMGTYERKDDKKGGGTVRLEPLPSGAKLTLQIGGIPDGAATKADCGFIAEGSITNGVFTGKVTRQNVLEGLSPEGDPAEAGLPPFSATVKGKVMTLKEPEGTSLCGDDGYAFEGSFIRGK